ncbi:MAG: hypothetical protein ACXACU_13995 [Candidatus Hodarchaeales archaeon]
MVATENNDQTRQQIILDTLSNNNNSLTLLDLKQASQIANLYFFKALDQLESQNAIKKVKKDRITWITLL